MKFFRNLFLLSMVLFIGAGCASSRRMMRISPFNEESDAEKRVNIFPLCYREDDKSSIMWPIYDNDDQGIAVRPFFNKEKSDVSILFPLSAWNTDDGNGWALNTVWGRNSLGVLPRFYYNIGENKNFVNALIFFNFYNHDNKQLLLKNDKLNILAGPLFWECAEVFLPTPGAANIFFLKELDTQCGILKKAIESDDMSNLNSSRKIIAEILNEMNCSNDFEIPENMEEFEDFIHSLRLKFCTNYSSKSSMLFPLYGESESLSGISNWYILGLLRYYENQTLHNPFMKLPEYKKIQTVENESSNTLLLFGEYKKIYRRFPQNVSQYEAMFYHGLHSTLQLLALSLDCDEYAKWKKDSSYVSESKKIREQLNTFAKILGIELPALDTPVQCYVFRKETEGMCLEYFSQDNSYFMPLYENESGKNEKFEIFPIFFTEKSKISDYIQKERTSYLLLGYSNTEKGKTPPEKYAAVFEEIKNLEQLLAGVDIKVNLKEKMQEAGLDFAVPENYRECHELRKKIYALVPENEEHFSCFIPLYFYSSNKLKQEKSLFVLPGFFYSEDGGNTKFSFLHRIVNIEKSSDGVNGHIFYIPFGN